MASQDNIDLPEKVAARQLDSVEELDGHAVNQEDHELTIRQAFKTQTKAILWAFFAVWVLLLAAYDNSAPSLYLSIPEFRKSFGSPFDGDWVLDARWQSAFNAAPVATSIVGALASAGISDIIGRKYTVMGALVISYAAITLEMVATTNAQWFGGEFLNGFAVGTFGTVCITYVEEVVPLPLRGVMNCVVALAYTVAPFLTSLVLYGVGNITNRWAYRSLIVSQYFFAATSTILVFFMPESPYWLASKGRDTAALRSLRRLGTTNGDEHKRLANIKLTLERIRAETEGVTYVECFRGSNLRRTIISIAPLSIQALSGISWINGYSTYYMELAGYSNRMSFLLTVIANLIGIVGNVVSWWLIDRVGRRDLTFYGLLSCTIVFLVTGGVACDTSDANAYRVTVAFILIWGFFFCSTIGSSAYALLGEVATARLRGKTVALGLALQNGIYLAISFILPYLFNPDKANLGAKVAFIFAAISVLCLVYLFYYQPETTGRSYEELDEMFMKHIPARQFKHYKPEAQIDGEVATAVLKGEIQAATVQEAKLVSA